MALRQTAILAFGLFGLLSAQVLGDTISPVKTTVVATASTGAPIAGASVVSIYFPGADSLPYVASLIGQNNGAATLAISCGPGVDSDTCGFPSSVTVTAGPSTAYVSVSNTDATFIYDCKISALTTAVCVETFNGDVAYIATTTGKGAPTGSTSSVLTETLASTDITWMPITITAWAKGATWPTAVSTGSGSGTNGGGNNNPWGNVVISSSSSTTTTKSTTTTGTTSTGTKPTGNTPWGTASVPSNSWGTASIGSGTSSNGSNSWGTASVPSGTSPNGNTPWGTASVPSGTSPAGNNAWSNANMPSGSALTPVAGATTGSGTTAGSTSKTSGWPITYTGAAHKIGPYGNYAAGLLALVGMAL